MLERLKRIYYKLYLKIGKHDRKSNVLRKLGVNLGKGCEFYSNISFGSEPYLITIGDNVRVAKGVNFITHDGGVWTLRKMKLLENADIFGTIKIGDNVHIGTNAIIMPNVNIGDNCVIGCGAVVTKDIPDNSIAVGVPARVIKTTQDYYEKCKKNCDFIKHMTSNEKKIYLSSKYNCNLYKS